MLKGTPVAAKHVLNMYVMFVAMVNGIDSLRQSDAFMRQ